MARRIVLTVAVLALAGAGTWYFTRGDTEPVSPYRFVTLEQGDLEAVVASTGLMDAVTTVQVGTQVSGIISEIYVDFNDHVVAGQVIARIDTTLLSSAVRDAEANLQRNQAQLRQSRRELERVRPLHEQQFVTEVEFHLAEYNLDIALAATRSAEISLDRARQNLSYATIYAPINGTVIERNVDVGQTVAASFSAPQLFLIADDLSRMEILASVDESDIGQIQDGQVARFTVQAYPDEIFFGTVRQVRLQSTILENVVNYTAVVDVENPDRRLLPGMTATVEFLIETASDVLKVPNAALRFRATASMYERLRAQFESRADSGEASRPQTRPGGGGFGQGNGGFGGEAALWGGTGMGDGADDRVVVWFVSEAGDLTMVPARTGISDGQMTEIRSERLEPGMQVIAGVTELAEGDSNNPFQQQQQRWRPGGF